ncbi:phage tail protein [Brachyspira pilosicoli]|uniref:Phage tail protein n=1 Tax=Brachyspira pilosicoli TaxID=52584 RepID=A0AAJ6KDD3_BRAPL|nr:phage tail protein [Brachyspira pilosicoli]WIH89770.1 phage tail protein [Brachyspira pilosicoli]WIH92065.1 phage tail protein [Brachyspira pilosicoli]WIH94294.1 phage tail protein [Brachyspira pilosicoli]
MVFVIYDKYNYKCYFVEGQSINDFKLKPNEVIKEHNSNDLSQTDIRAYNDDGSVKTLEEQLKEKIITLKDNEIIDNGIIRELNKNYEDDYIVMIERGLENLDKSKKISEKNGKKYIIEKTIEEKYQENLITKEEYNSCIINQRQSEYSQNLDGVRAELLDSVLNNCASKGLLNENQIEVLKTIEDNRAKIKTQYKKIL